MKTNCTPGCEHDGCMHYYILQLLEHDETYHIAYDTCKACELARPVHCTCKKDLCCGIAYEEHCILEHGHHYEPWLPG